MHRIYILKIFCFPYVSFSALKATPHTLSFKPPSRRPLRRQTADWCCWCWPSHCFRWTPPPHWSPPPPTSSSRGSSASSWASAVVVAVLYSYCCLGRRRRLLWSCGHRWLRGWPGSLIVLLPLRGSIRSCSHCSCSSPRKPSGRPASLEGVDSSYCTCFGRWPWPPC